MNKGLIILALETLREQVVDSGETPHSVHTTIRLARIDKQIKLIKQK
jgi:hypothetical protein